MSVAVGPDSAALVPFSTPTGDFSNCRVNAMETWRPVSEPTVFDDLYDASLDAIAMAGSDYSEGLRGRESRACVF